MSEQAGTPVFDESDLTLKKLDEYHAQLQELQKEKVNLSSLWNSFTLIFSLIISLYTRREFIVGNSSFGLAE